MTKEKSLITWTPRRRELALEYPVDKLVPGELTVGVLVQFPEQIRHPRLLVVVVLQEPLAPLVPVKVLHLLQLLKMFE
jgi:hypothetical protein